MKAKYADITEENVVITTTDNKAAEPGPGVTIRNK
jgi:hypothetical protein